MTWVKVDDAMPRHPKLLSLGRDRLPCQGLWLDGMCYSSAYLTDGFVPVAALERGCEKYAKLLVKAGLWESVDGGYRIHDYHEYQPSRADVTERRRRDAQRQSRHRHGVTPDGVEASRPVPSRPVPVDTYEYLDPRALYQEKVGRKPGRKEADWLEDLHVRFSRSELVRAMQATPSGPDFLKRLDAYIEGHAA